MDAFWVVFVPQLLASLAGAVVGLVGVLVGFWLQRRAAQRDAVDAAAARAVDALGTYAAEAEAHTFAWQVRSLPGSSGTPARLRHEAPAIALDLLLIAAQRNERATVRSFVRAFKQIKSGGDDKVNAMRWLGRAITRWRAEGLVGTALAEEVEVAVLIARGEAPFDTETFDD